MTLRRPPPPGQTRTLAIWLDQLTDTINGLPAFSVQSFDGHANDSAVTGDPGTILINRASSQTTVAWMKQSGSTITGWKAFDLS